MDFVNATAEDIEQVLTELDLHTSVADQVSDDETALVVDTLVQLSDKSEEITVGCEVKTILNFTK